MMNYGVRALCAYHYRANELEWMGDEGHEHMKMVLVPGTGSDCAGLDQQRIEIGRYERRQCFDVVRIK